MAPTHEVHVKVTPELSEEFEALLGTATADTLAKLNAGASLVHAMYHCPKADVEAFFTTMPRAVVLAYSQACAAYGLGHHGSQAVEVAESVSPLECLADEG
jgi:hypothetical protein